jgi:hypothetical protein
MIDYIPLIRSANLHPTAPQWRKLPQKRDQSLILPTSNMHVHRRSSQRAGSRRSEATTRRAGQARPLSRPGKRSSWFSPPTPPGISTAIWRWRGSGRMSTTRSAWRSSAGRTTSRCIVWRICMAGQNSAEAVPAGRDRMPEKIDPRTDLPELNTRLLLASSGQGKSTSTPSQTSKSNCPTCGGDGLVLVPAPWAERERLLIVQTFKGSAAVSGRSKCPTAHQCSRRGQTVRAQRLLALLPDTARPVPAHSRAPAHSGAGQGDGRMDRAADKGCILAITPH